MKFLKLMIVAALLWSGAAQAQYVPGVRVEVAPPPLRVEQRGFAPSPNHIWINGHWAWRYGRHEWVGGHWALPPGAGYRWEDARWVNEGGRWVFFEGHWIPPANPVYVEPAGPGVEVAVAPPPPIVENRPPVPGAGYVWAPGYWRWQEGHHVWVAGYWAPPRVGYHWVEHHWENRGGRWVFVEGGWRR
jgi:hypothetical protein